MQLDYLLNLPRDYHKTKTKYPLLLFLHGAGERGNDLNRVKIHGPVNYANSHPEFPFIIVSPQCPGDSWWTEQFEELIALLDEVSVLYRVDKKRIYLTGISMGGEGTWKLAMMYPRRFAAIIPICGKGNPWLADKIKEVPIWVFHGAKDDAIPVSESEMMVNALKKLHMDIRFTVYPEAGHDSWTKTYNNPEIYDWLLKHKLQNKE